MWAFFLDPCRIVPGQNPLAKHKFYFDLKNRLAANKLEAQIKELGGVSVHDYSYAF